MNKKLIAITHYLIVVLAISLPFWLDWEIVALLVIGYHLVFTRGIGFCPLTVWQFGTAEEGFIEKHIVAFLRIFGFSIPPRQQLKKFVRYDIPILLVIFSLLLQYIVY